MATKFSLNIFRLLKNGLDVSFLYFLGSVMGWTIETHCLFQRFFIILPKTLLFMSSFSKRLGISFSVSTYLWLKRWINSCCLGLSHSFFTFILSMAKG